MIWAAGWANWSTGPGFSRVYKGKRLRCTEIRWVISLLFFYFQEESPLYMYGTGIWELRSYGSGMFPSFVVVETQFRSRTQVYGEIWIKWQNTSLPLENTCSVVQKDLGHPPWLSLHILPLFACSQTFPKAETCWWINEDLNISTQSLNRVWYCFEFLKRENVIEKQMNSNREWIYPNFRYRRESWTWTNFSVETRRKILQGLKWKWEN